MSSDGTNDVSDENMVSTISASLDLFWLMFGAVLIFYMQIGFSMLEVGSVTTSSTKNVLIKNTLDAAISAFFWGMVGYGFAYGDSVDPKVGYLIGTTDFFFHNFEGEDYALWLFQWAFVATAATIVSGSVAERINFRIYVLFAIMLSVLTYPVIVHWTWSGDGFMSPFRQEGKLLFDCGVLDFAGSGVVHLTGGISALTAVILLGPRDGVKFTDDGKRIAPPGQSDTLKTLGTLSLWFGWFAFNGASTGAIVESSAVAARAMVMTAMSGAVGGISSAAYHSYTEQHAGNPQAHIQLGASLNGILAGLVGITANCATVRIEGALVIGIVSGILYNLAADLLDRWKIDDVVSAVPVHLVCGLWGLFAAGFFTVPRFYEELMERHPDDDDDDDLEFTCAGILYGGTGNLLGANLVFVLVTVPWNLATVGVLFYAAKAKKKLRVPRLVEMVGLDVMLHNDAPGGDDEDDAMERTHGGAKHRERLRRSMNDSMQSRDEPVSYAHMAAALGAGGGAPMHGGGGGGLPGGVGGFMDASVSAPGLVGSGFGDAGMDGGPGAGAMDISRSVALDLSRINQQQQQQQQQPQQLVPHPFLPGQQTSATTVVSSVSSSAEHSVERPQAAFGLPLAGDGADAAEGAGAAENGGGTGSARGSRVHPGSNPVEAADSDPLSQPFA